MKNTMIFAMVVALAGVAGAVNPITAEGEFLSDPAPRVGPDGKLWVFGSRDENPRYYCSSGNDAYETTDLRTWKVHRDVFTAASLPGVKVLYAPDALYHNGAWRLFFCTPSRKYMEGIASSVKPEGPFTNVQKLSACTQIDPAIFRDDDGTLYYNWGQFALNGAVLKDDLSGLVPGTLHTRIIDEAGHHFHEGIQLLKRKGLYYLVYTDLKTDGPRSAARIGYSTAEKPFGPYTYCGVIVDNTGCDPKTWNDHGGLVEFGGKWYIFYHRSTNGSNTMRKACVEPITFDEKGLIRPVEMTSNGAEPPLDPFTTVEARLACLLSGNVRIVTFPDKQERLAEIQAGDTALWRYFNFTKPAASLELTVKSAAGGTVTVLDGTGREHGTGTIPSGDGKTFATVTIPLSKPMPAGIQTVKFVFACPPGKTFGELDAWRFRP
ncbi:MAG: family 43 glycosylhydrolase [Kiritimatiellae bacterium]|nr:family 43 glycosylhydrolase [Kiritimatiellia bacterium]